MAPAWRTEQNARIVNSHSYSHSRLLSALFIDRVVSDCLLIENHSLTTFPPVNTETTSTYPDEQLVTWISEEIIICNGLYRRRRVLWRTGKDTFGAEFYRFSPRLNSPRIKHQYLPTVIP